MTTIREIEDRVGALSERVRRLHSGDFVAASFHTGAWWVRCHFSRVQDSGGCSSISEAFARFESNLAHAEKSSDMSLLCATLGVS